MNIITTLLSSRESYLKKQVQQHNSQLAFSYQTIPERQFIQSASGESLIVSGEGSRERASVILKLAEFYSERNFPVIILHAGSSYLSVAEMLKYGLPCQEWNYDPICHASLPEFISILTPDHRDNLTPFWVWVYQVLNAMGISISFRNLTGINWFDLSWQQYLLKKAPSDVAMDLIARYDHDMANLAAQATNQLYKLERSLPPVNAGCSLSEALSRHEILSVQLPGSSSALTSRYLDEIWAKAESGCKFLMILDNIYLQDHPLIRDYMCNVPLILSSSDICTYANHPSDLTRRRCNVILFKHAAGSADILSRYYFGEYEQLKTDTAYSHSSTKRQLLETTSQHTVTLHSSRELRLNPQELVQIPPGYGFCSLETIEGIIEI